MGKDKEKKMAAGMWLIIWFGVCMVGLGSAVTDSYSVFDSVFGEFALV
jgi:hypothetical protein